MSHENIDIGGFYIQFDKKDHQYTIYEPISGILYLKLRSDVRTKGLSLKVIGKLGVMWYESDGDISDSRIPYTAAHTFLNETIDFLKPEKAHENMTINKGDHEFKFSFKLADFLKPTQKAVAEFPFSSEHEYGNVKYIVTGVLHRSSMDPMLTDYQAVQFIDIISGISDTGEMHSNFVPTRTEQQRRNSFLPLPMSSLPTSSSNSTSVSSSSNNSKLKATINKAAFRPGEPINCLITLENDNSMRRFSKLYVKLIQHVSFHSTDPVPKVKSDKHQIFSYKQTDFDNHRLYEMDEFIQIPKSTKPPSTLDKSHHIQYRYELKVELYTAVKFLPTAPGQPIEVTIPIIIYNELV